MYSIRTPFFLRLFYPNAVWRVPTRNKEMFLTFDDGPTPGVTEKVLEILDQHNAKAVFFCIASKALEHPELVTEILKRGHRVGNHSWSHPDGWKVSAAEYLSDVKVAEDCLRGIPGTEPEFFRPPYGHISRHLLGRLCTNHKVIMWDVMPGDFDERKTSDRCLSQAIAKSRQGSILVFHDSLKAESRLLPLLPKFLAHFVGQGFNFPLIP